MLDGRLNIRVPLELKQEFKRIADTEGYERLSTAIRDAIREIVQRGYIRSRRQTPTE